MEDLRILVIRRTSSRRIDNKKFKGNYAPRMQEKIKDYIKDNIRFKLEFNRDMDYEVINMSNKDNKYIVKLERAWCLGRKWDLTSILFEHAMPVINHKELKVGGLCK